MPGLVVVGPTGPCPTTALAGSGATATPNFVTDAILTPDAVGSLTIGGAAVDAGNGFALGNVSSPATITPSGAEDLVPLGANPDLVRVCTAQGPCALEKRPVLCAIVCNQVAISAAKH